MHRKVRFQWHIAWKNGEHHRLALFLVLGLLLSIADTSMVARLRYNKSTIPICNDYIPFETVLKTNFNLQEQNRKLTNALQDSENKLEVSQKTC